jgi:hypothetical protein
MLTIFPPSFPIGILGIKEVKMMQGYHHKKKEIRGGPGP